MGKFRDNLCFLMELQDFERSLKTIEDGEHDEHGELIYMKVISCHGWGNDLVMSSTFLTPCVHVPSAQDTRKPHCPCVV